MRAYVCMCVVFVHVYVHMVCVCICVYMLMCVYLFVSAGRAVVWGRDMDAEGCTCMMSNHLFHGRCIRTILGVISDMEQSQ